MSSFIWINSGFVLFWFVLFSFLLIMHFMLSLLRFKSSRFIKYEFAHLISAIISGSLLCLVVPVLLVTVNPDFDKTRIILDYSKEGYVDSFSSTLNAISITHPDLLSKIHTIELSNKALSFEFGRFTKIGSYSMVGKRIEMYVDEPDTWWHEIGHLIWYEYMTFSERKEYEVLHKADLIRVKHGIFPYTSTEYSLTSVEEDWADHFQRYTMEYICENECYSIYCRREKQYRTELMDFERKTIIKSVLQNVLGQSNPLYFVSCSIDKFI
jgi:hypothetical protein